MQALPFSLEYTLTCTSFANYRWVGYSDAYKALPSWRDMASTWSKVFMAVAVLGLYAALDNILVLLAAGYFYRKWAGEKKKREEAALAAMVTN